MLLWRHISFIIGRNRLSLVLFVLVRIKDISTNETTLNAHFIVLVLHANSRVTVNVLNFCLFKVVPDVLDLPNVPGLALGPPTVYTVHFSVLFKQVFVEVTSDVVTFL